MGKEAFNRAERRAHAPRRRRPRGQYVGETGRQRRQRWAQERYSELARESHRLGLGEIWGPADERRVVIELNRRAAALAGVSNSTWACMTSKQRRYALILADSDYAAEIRAAS